LGTPQYADLLPKVELKAERLRRLMVGAR
jgi:hypothetical protein